ncbi:FxSxx-COOH system tetratricopeptide repeat protein [Kitasatospora sp. NPDC058170]|uniref:FxSxx-COOH system tetratricopeptide repeat protein n=1 Tax=Kitasatospora sp. NPDC058170 TaxID=3346364 RepID=UPI0036D9143D
MTADDRPDAVPGPRSITAQHITTAITGDITGDIVLPAEAFNTARTIEAPPGAANLAPAPVCLGREDELAWLQRTLATDGGTAVTQAPALHGLGGVGKSTLALHYAHRHRHTYALTWWINAESPARIEQSLAALALFLHPSWAGRAAEQSRTAWATNWLQWHPGWLLVFDNAEDPRDLLPYTGALAGGHHLITTRRATGWPRTVPTLPLGTLAPDDAAQLLCSYAFEDTEPTPRDLHDARLLAADLGHLPLALDQAGAYLAQVPTSIDAYRRTLATKLARAADGIDPERTIATIWAHTLTTLRTRNPLAVTVLDTLAWFAPDDIPLTLLDQLDEDEDDIREALAVLRAYSMISLTRDTVGIHRLVQTVLRDQPDHPGRQAAEQALGRALDTAPATGSAWDPLIPHLIALAATTPPGHRPNPAARHYNTAAQYLWRQGHDARTIALREADLAHREETLGDTHPDTLATRSNLAAAYQEAGDLDRAIPLHETALAQCEQVLGPTHADTLSSRNNLANAYQSAGHPGRAVPLQETTLAIREQVLGPTHPDTLISRNNLATVYHAVGDLGRAVPLAEQTLTQREQTLGPSHPHTLSSRGLLAYIHESAGDSHRAIPLFETTLAHQRQVLGDAHPDTLLTCHNLAFTYASAGLLDRAIALCESTLAQREQVLGPSHPDTLSSRNHLASAYATAGDLDRAIPLFEDNLAQTERALGDAHPQTLASRASLASAYTFAGDLDRAVPLLETTLTQRTQILGPTHPDTLTTHTRLLRTLTQRDERRPGHPA